MSKKQEYYELLKDPRWQKKRLEILERDNWTCQVCTETTKNLHIHHQYYLNNTLPWEYPNEALQTLCADCHEYETTAINKATYQLLLLLKQKGFCSLDFENLISFFEDKDKDTIQNYIYHAFNSIEVIEKIKECHKEECKAFYETVQRHENDKKQIIE